MTSHIPQTSTAMQRLLLPLLLLLGITISCKKDKHDAYAITEVIFEADQTEISAGDSVTFKDLSVGYVTHWKWTFEGGEPATSNLSQPTVVYKTPGVYEVTVELSNGKKSTTLTKKEYIRVDYNQVQADFTASATVIFMGESITFKDSSKGGPDNWQWEFVPVAGGTTLTSTEQNPTITFNTEGYYTVSLTASNPIYSDTETKVEFIRVLDPNDVSAAFSSNTTATYAGGSIQFTDESLGLITSWNWTFEGPVTLTATDQHPVVNFTQPGRYTVKLTVANNTVNSTAELPDHILVVPGDQLAAFFPFNGNIADAGPHGISTHSLGAGVSFTNADRKMQTANTGTFNGATGVIVSDHAALNFGSNDFSISCWVKTSNTGRMMVWQESGKNGTNDNQTWLRMGDNSTDRRLRFTIEDNTGSSIINMGSDGFVADGQWHHIVAVRQGVNTTVYIDGTEVATRAAGNVKVVSNNQDFKIGVQEGASSNSSFFDGEIDDVIIYNKALTPAEIIALFNL